jgi:hypothetical protein
MKTPCNAAQLAMRICIALGVLFISSACTSFNLISVPNRSELAPTDAQANACEVMYTRMDQDIEIAGVRNAGAHQVAQYPYLRVDRFFAALGRNIGSQDSSLDEQASYIRRAAIFGQLRQLDLKARQSELMNLSSQAPAVNYNMATLARCSEKLTEKIVRNRALAAALLNSLAVPDDYETAYRIFGGYYLLRIPFSMGIQRLENQRSAVISQPFRASSATEARLSLGPQRAMYDKAMVASEIAQMVSPDRNNPLMLPNPSASDLEKLFLHFAPIFDIGISSADDQPGALTWNAKDQLKVDHSQPVVYSSTSFTTYQGRHLLQLNYTLWFPARPKSASTLIDLLAGHLDGVVLRVTLAPDGTPLVYDSIHPCGCYHTFFTVGTTALKPAPSGITEWAFMPRALPKVLEHQRPLLRIAPETHYIDGIEIVDKVTTFMPSSFYQLLDYAALTSLPRVSGQPGWPIARQSAFNSKGFIPNTERLESFLFWPMGIKNAGAMRQAGRQATAFVGRRHFDDPDLFESRFLFDPVHFR